MDNRNEKFKLSQKSKCRTCSNINERCDFAAHKVCETDSKAELSYVVECNQYNKPFGENKVISGGSISVGHKADSRVEMMGGGHE